MTTGTSQRMTVEEFQKLPEDSGAVFHELRRGEPVAVTRPKFRLYALQRRLRRLLESALSPSGMVDIEFAFRPLPEHELRVADVAFVFSAREAAIDPNDHLRGAPDLTIEVISPSNTPAELADKRKLCLENGCQEFWMVEPDRRQVSVFTPDGRSIIYQTGEAIPLNRYGQAARIAAGEIFV